MTSLRLTRVWLAASSMLAIMTLSACPRGDFDLGIDDAGTETGNQNMEPGKDKDAGADNKVVACGSRGLPECDDDEFCSYPQSASCGETDKAGVCKKKPDVCTKIYKPVCGCDGKTYGNSCEAETAGVSARSDGECDSSTPTEKVCGGFSGKQCDDGEYCNYPDGAMCGIADATGVCEKRPDDCKGAGADPVCGCNGVTYSNVCEANRKGFGIMNTGKCESQQNEDGAVCGVRGAKECADNEYCYFTRDAQCAAADVPGHCRKRPDNCTLELKEVCGCDGKTYGNECSASMEGAGVAHDGTCETMSEPAACGGLQGLQCAKGEYCKYEPAAQCGAADQTGVCTVIKQACTREFHQVCACDGKTYNNPCEAGAAGQSVVSDGACPTSSPAACGGLQGLKCQDGEFCNFAPAAQCGAADQLGECTAIPSVCTKELHEVCGCDGKTYGNACEAKVASQSVVSDGKCPTTSPAACGGLQGLQCADKQFCNFAPAAQCGAADQLGECSDVPDVCTLESKPVCGCDGKTYGNACEAKLAKQSIVSEGECRKQAAENEMCGGFAGVQCSGNLFCDFAPATHCGSGDQSGICKSKPDACTADYKPVCGCDMKTYGNACNAQGAGVSVLHDGEC